MTAPLQLGEEIAIDHGVSLGAERVETELPRVLDEHATDADPLEPTWFAPTSQHRTNAERQPHEFGTDPVVRHPAFKVIAVGVGRQRAQSGSAAMRQLHTPRHSCKRCAVSAPRRKSSDSYGLP